ARTRATRAGHAVFRVDDPGPDRRTHRGLPDAGLPHPVTHPDHTARTSTRRTTTTRSSLTLPAGSHIATRRGRPLTKGDSACRRTTLQPSVPCWTWLHR